MSSSPRPRTNRVRGTCRYYSGPGGCFAGAQCKFLHVAPDAGHNESALSPYDANKVCRYFVQGYCHRGTACWFKHEMPGAASSSAPERTVPAPAPAPAVTNDDDDHLCAICLDKPDEYGLLENCNHIFCKTCIRGWRDPAGKSVDVLISQMNKTCPSCRSRSRFIIPSSRFPGSTDSKKTIVDNYKASMARKDCRYFVVARDKPFCPYGRDCFYKHELADGTPYVFTEGVDTLMERWKRRRQTEAVRRQPSNERNFALAIRSIADSLFEIAAGVSGAQMPQIRAAQARALARLAGAPQDEEDDAGDGPPPLESISDAESDDGTWEDTSEDEDIDPHSAAAIERSLYALQDLLALASTAPTDPAPSVGPQRPRSPDPNRQFDVFDLD